MYVFKVVCAWCKKNVINKTNEGDIVSHTICHKCFCDMIREGSTLHRTEKIQERNESVDLGGEG